MNPFEQSESIVASITKMRASDFLTNTTRNNPWMKRGFDNKYIIQFQIEMESIRKKRKKKKKENKEIEKNKNDSTHTTK